MWKTVHTYLPPLLWAGLIFFLSNQSTLPSMETNLFDFAFKKLAHVTVYAVLYLLIYRAMLLNAFSPRQLLVWPIALCFVYALSDELHQSFTPGRHPALMDIGFDMVGVGIAWLKKNRLARFF